MTDKLHLPKCFQLLLLLLSLASVQGAIWAQDIADKVPVYLETTCDGRVSNQLCYHVKEEIRESERFRITDLNTVSSIGLIIITTDIEEIDASTYSISVIHIDPYSEKELRESANALSNLDDYTFEEAQKSLKQTPKRKFINSMVGFCPQSRCESSALSIISFLDDSVSQSKGSLIRLETKFK